MKLVKSANKLTNYLNNLQTEDKSVQIGFVPTMGALHAGHMRLIDQSVRENDITVCSIFVNPTQFGDASDLANYPKPIESDIKQLIHHNCDILFLPEIKEVYPQEYHQQHFNLDGIDLIIEGAQRPGHFQGVCNVLSRLFFIVQPNRAYFGQKDYQQTLVVKKLIRLLNLPIEISIVPIAREENGLAMSSRNQRLSKEARKNASFINHTLLSIKEEWKLIGLEQAIENSKNYISRFPGVKLEYLLAVDGNTLLAVDKNSTSIVILIVVKLEGVRLLDNIILA